MKLRFWILAVVAGLACGWAAPLYADVEVTASVQPAAAAIGSEVVLIVTVSGQFRRSSDPDLPDLPDFDIYQAGTSQQFSFSNGRQSASVEYRYVLVPKKAGTYSIAPIRFTVNDKTYTATAVKLEVVDNPTALSAPSSGVTQGSAEEAVGQPLYVLGTVSADTVYVNEQVTWTLGFYTDGRTELLRSPEYQPPNAEGFWVEDLPPQKNHQRMINGREYVVTEIKRAFFPTAPGLYKIGAARVDVVTNDATARNTIDDIFRRRGGFGFGKPKSLHSKEITIVVLPLPTTGRPANFTGLVGTNLSVELTVDKQVVNAGDPVNVALEISGEGNFKTIAAPALPDLPQFKRYESGSKSDLFKSNYMISGRKKTDFVLIPRTEGTHVIPAVAVAFFDPVQRRYRTASSNPIELSVQPGLENEGSPVIFTGSGQEIQVLGRDISFIRPVPGSLPSGGSPWGSRPFTIVLHALPLLALMASIVVEQRRRRWSDSTALARAMRAAGQVEKSLSQVRRGNAENAHAITAAALRDYIADKMDASSAGITATDIDVFLARKGVDDETIGWLRDILGRCDAVQYSGGGASGAADRVVEDALQLVQLIEKKYMR